MPFNPDKCEVLTVTAKQKNIIKAEYTIYGKPLNTVSSGNLGLTIDTKLNYNEHVNNICKKANSTLAFIHRNIRCPRKVKATAYNSFVRPQLEYALTVWGPHTANNINQIEAVQRRAARSVMNDWSRPHSQSGRSSSSKGSPTLMMQQLGWNTLEVRRNQARAVMIYRIVNGLIAIPASLYLTPNTQNTKGHGCKFRVPAGCVDAFNYSFFPTTIRIWNQLPATVVMSPSSEAFKSRLLGIPATQTSI